MGESYFSELRKGLTIKMKISILQCTTLCTSIVWRTFIWKGSDPLKWYFCFVSEPISYMLYLFIFAVVSQQQRWIKFFISISLPPITYSLLFPCMNNKCFIFTGQLFREERSLVAKGIQGGEAGSERSRIENIYIT